ncbi:MAG: serine hydrolase [Desulfobacteraceae bacterium]|nr:serine hydrolase [Desulfobacteraceae bacterium]
MRNTIIRFTTAAIMIAVLSALLFSCQEEKSSVQTDYFPTAIWAEATPESMGMDPEKLAAVHGYCSREFRDTCSYMIIKDGYIVQEAYFNGTARETPFESYSIAKNVTSALTGIAIEQGYINGIDDAVHEYFPQWQGSEVDPLKQEITIRHLLTMKSGLMWHEDALPFGGGINDIYNLKLYARNYIEYVLEKPVMHQPGSAWNYSSGMPILLSGIIENTTGRLTSDFARDNLFNPLGVENWYWETDPSGQTNGAWGISMTTRDYARFGYLYLKKGVWSGRQIIPETWVAESQAPADEDTLHFGFLWWKAERYPDAAGIKIPADTYMAVGLFQRYIIIIPSYNLVLVRMGDNIKTGEDGWDTAEFISLVLDAID